MQIARFHEAFERRDNLAARDAVSLHQASGLWLGTPDKVIAWFKQNLAVHRNPKSETERGLGRSCRINTQGS